MFKAYSSKWFVRIDVEGKAYSLTLLCMSQQTRFGQMSEAIVTRSKILFIISNLYSKFTFHFIQLMRWVIGLTIWKSLLKISWHRLVRYGHRYSVCFVDHSYVQAGVEEVDEAAD